MTATETAFDWLAAAACVGLYGTMHPESGPASDRAVAVCAECPVRPECLVHTASTDESWDYGVWAGTRASLRTKKMSRRRALLGHYGDPMVDPMPPPAKRMPGEITHPGPTAWRDHRTAGEMPCIDCREWKAALEQRRRVQAANRRKIERGYA